MNLFLECLTISVNLLLWNCGVIKYNYNSTYKYIKFVKHIKKTLNLTLTLLKMLFKYIFIYIQIGLFEMCTMSIR